MTTLGCPRVLKTSNSLDLEDLLVEGDCTYAFSAPLKATCLCRSLYFSKSPIFAFGTRHRPYAMGAVGLRLLSVAVEFGFHATIAPCM